MERGCNKSGHVRADALEPFQGSKVAIGGAIGPQNGLKGPKLGHFVAITTSGGSKLVELCGTRLQQVRACPGRCIETISRIRSGHRRCHRPSKWAKRAQIGPFCGHNHFWWLTTGETVWNKIPTSQGTSGPMHRNHFTDQKWPSEVP